MVMGGSVFHLSGLTDWAIGIVKIDPDGCSEKQRTDGRWHGGQAQTDIVTEIGKNITAVHEDIGLTLDGCSATKFDGEIG